MKGINKGLNYRRTRGTCSRETELGGFSKEVILKLRPER